jgi:hypothetical protein
MLQIEREQPGRAAEVAPGFWVVPTRHRPGLSKQMFEINNRCLVFRLQDREGPVLLAVNQTDPVAIPVVKEIEQQTGLKMRYLVSPGGGHHLQIEPWHAAFTDATVYVGPTRIPRTEHGRHLMSLPRVQVTPLDDPFPQFRGQIEFTQFQGLLGLHDGKSPGEGGKDNLWYVLRIFREMMRVSDPIDELWLCHVPSRTVVGGENLGWMYGAADLAKEGMMARSMLKADQIYVQTGPRKVGDKAKVEASWRRILAWPCDAVMTYHDVTGFAFRADAANALRDAVRVAGQLPASA